MSRTGRRSGRIGWWTIATIATVLIVGSIIATLALRGGAESTATPTPSTSPTGEATVSGAAAGANGCLAGPGITAEQLKQIRAKKDFTPTGAVEFLGALVQFYTAADPTYRQGIEQVTAEMMTGDARAEFAPLNASTAPDDGNTHASFLGEGYYDVVAATADEVTVDITAEQLRNGSPIPGDTHGSIYGGQRYTVKPSPDGWVVSSTGTPAKSVQQMIETGQRFQGGC
ncbi:hypothetical protein [Clavibacter michiganensis]|uniref:hypothetical protein n=1 Tax=Clavibacter michiganensis TaxID=28447 RepID=UPI00292D7C18|nr:hypothetical protein [Clavibacter michiganensis]